MRYRYTALCKMLSVQQPNNKQYRTCIQASFNNMNTVYIGYALILFGINISLGFLSDFSFCWFIGTFLGFIGVLMVCTNNNDNNNPNKGE